jgi:hypothetical protein
VANHCYIIVADYDPRISGNEQKEIMGSQLARAWIETCANDIHTIKQFRSRNSRARGLRHRPETLSKRYKRRNSRARVD